MIEECRQRDTLAQNITCHEVDGESAGALCGLCIGGLDTTYERLVVAPRQIKIERKVIGDTPLLSSDLQNLVEISNLVSRAECHLL